MSSAATSLISSSPSPMAVTGWGLTAASLRFAGRTRALRPTRPRPELQKDKNTHRPASRCQKLQQNGLDTQDILLSTKTLPEMLHFQRANATKTPLLHRHRLFAPGQRLKGPRKCQGIKWRYG